MHENVCFLHVSFFTWDTLVPPGLFFTRMFFSQLSSCMGHVSSPGIFYTHVFYKWVFLQSVFFPPAPLFTGRFFYTWVFLHNVRFFSLTLGVFYRTRFSRVCFLHVCFLRMSFLHGIPFFPGCFYTYVFYNWVSIIILHRTRLFSGHLYVYFTCEFLQGTRCRRITKRDTSINYFTVM
jgi:hypothetical protein